ncbi:hypothetical protein ACJMK2_012355 [Sinanodonta woodiana]|uniref:Uncharacterized protein n=1 Tax=Sinanodonta woodiana TaxID=1069815 RepID=A0ABD3VAV7_SINWO
MVSGRIMLTLLLITMVLISIPEPSHALACYSIGWGGCMDGGCYRSGGYCVNFGRPPRNRCVCVPRW